MQKKDLPEWDGIYLACSTNNRPLIHINCATSKSFYVLLVSWNKMLEQNKSVHLHMIRDRRKQYRTSCILVTLTGPV